ncbi:MAG: hypothetical protein GX335_01945 [Firmicutes bacterium]|nr:hypothetical protein [Bacillota bacterium]
MKTVSERLSPRGQPLLTGKNSSSGLSPQKQPLSAGIKEEKVNQNLGILYLKEITNE